MKKRVFDLEATNLLTQETIDYTAAPFKLKPGFLVHCGVVIDVDTNEQWSFVGDDEIINGMIPLLEDSDVIIGHNIINYDLLVLKLKYGMNYTVGPDTINGKPVLIYDTLVISKMLNPDRPAHSLDYFGDKIGLEKIDWRTKAIELGLIKFGDARGAEFRLYHPEMLVYNIRDVELNVLVYKFLMSEWGAWDWAEAFQTETAVADIITRQSHRGFAFNSEMAKDHCRELDILMENARVVVEPLIPPKKPTQAQAKEYCPPKIQVKKTDGSITAVMHKWVAKHGGTSTEATEDLPAFVEVFGKVHRLPMPQESLMGLVPAKIDDTTHIKGWLVSLGWVPSSWKERDLTVDSKKRKLSEQPEVDKDGNLKPSQFEATIRRYMNGTLDSPFCKFKLEKLKTALRSQWSIKYMKANPEAVIDEILSRGTAKPLKVWTNPQITVGQDKEICPQLEAMSDQFAHTRDITSYLTYKHRRNSILGGGFDPDEDEEPEKGYLAYAREDGRISTPADTCGAGTSRFKHRQVANIPRTSSLYGRQMRDLFGADSGCYQLGYDFDSLEAKIEAHYCWRYDRTKDYCHSLTALKPHDIHTVTAASISLLIGQDFSRTNAKSVKYGASYGAQAARIAAIVGCDMSTAESIFYAFWESAKPLAMLKKRLTEYWKTTGGKKFILGVDGRKIMTRSEHALINSLFQSAGVICAKKAMVLHDQKLKKEGLLIDFFVDNWTELEYCQQMIAYHDEAQSEVSKALVKFKFFDTEQSAAEFKANESKVWSDISKAKDGRFFVAYCRAGELAVEAVIEAGEHYKLNVDLSAGYVIGTTWGNTH